MISLIIFAIGAYVVIAYMTSSGPNVDERVYLRTTYNHLASSGGYVRMQDMEPNSFGYFAYPNSYNFTDPANAYQRFILIRLPSWMGGDKNDISSYRAYSAIDLDSHCMLRYWPQDGRQSIQDVCHFENYRIVDGASYYPGIKIMAKPVENALPELDLRTDSDGYIYVKPPTWTADKNGLIGDGRHVTKEQTLETSKALLADYENSIQNKISFPLNLDANIFLIDIVQGNMESDLRYATENVNTNSPTFRIIFCNCTGKGLSDMHPSGSITSSSDLDIARHMQVWKNGDVIIYSSTYDNAPKKTSMYIFQFFDKGYKIVFYSGMEFSDGMNLVLDNFFNGTKLSDFEQIPTP
jgi:hypothetical protein